MTAATRSAYLRTWREMHRLSPDQAGKLVFDVPARSVTKWEKPGHQINGETWEWLLGLMADWELRHEFDTAEALADLRAEFPPTDGSDLPARLVRYADQDAFLADMREGTDHYTNWNRCMGSILAIYRALDRVVEIEWRAS